MLLPINFDEVIVKICKSYPKCEEEYLQLLCNLSLEQLIHQFKSVLLDPTIAGKALCVLSELCSRYNNLTVKEVELLLEFFAAKIGHKALRSDAFKSLSLFITSIQSTYKCTPNMFEVLAKNFLSKTNVQEIRLEQRKYCYIILRYMINDATVRMCSLQILQKIMQSIDGESNPELVLISFSIHIVIYDNIDRVKFVEVLEEMFDSVATYFPVIYNQPPNCNVSKNDLRFALHKCLAHPIYKDIAIPFLINKAILSHSTSTKLDVFDVLLECSKTYSWNLLRVYVHDIIQIVKNEIIKLSSQIAVTNDAKQIQETLNLAYFILERISELPSMHEVDTTTNDQYEANLETMYNVIIEGVVETLNVTTITWENGNTSSNKISHQQMLTNQTDKSSKGRLKQSAKISSAQKESLTNTFKAYATMIYHICIGGECTCVAFIENLLPIVVNKLQENIVEFANNNVIIILSALLYSICDAFDRHHRSTELQTICQREIHIAKNNIYRWANLHFCVLNLWEALCEGINKIMHQIRAQKCTSDFEVLLRVECISSFLQFATIRISPALPDAMAAKLISTLFNVAIDGHSSESVHEQITKVILKCEIDYNSVVYACITDLVNNSQETLDDKEIHFTLQSEVDASMCYTQETLEKNNLPLSSSQSQETTNAINSSYVLDLILQFLLNDPGDESSMYNNCEKYTLYFELLSEVLLTPGETKNKWTEALSISQRANAAEQLLRDKRFLLTQEQLHYLFNNKVTQLLYVEYFRVTLLLVQRYECEVCVSHLLKLLTSETSEQMHAKINNDIDKFPLLFTVAALVVHGKSLITQLVHKRLLSFVWRQLLQAHNMYSTFDAHLHDIIFTGMVQLVYLVLWHKLIGSVDDGEEFLHLERELENFFNVCTMSKDNNNFNLENYASQNTEIRKDVADKAHNQMTSLIDDLVTSVIGNEDESKTELKKVNARHEELQVLVTLSVVWGIITFTVREQITSRNGDKLFSTLREYRQAKLSVIFNKVITIPEENSNSANTFIACLKYVPVNLQENACVDQRNVEVHADVVNFNVCTDNSSDHFFESLRDVNEAHQSINSINNDVHRKAELMESEQTNIQTTMLLDYITIELNELTNTSFYWHGLASLLMNIQEVCNIKICTEILRRLQVVNLSGEHYARQIISILLTHARFVELFVTTLEYNTNIINAILHGLSDHRSCNRLQSLELLTKIGHACITVIKKKDDRIENIQDTGNQEEKNIIREQNEETSTHEIDDKNELVMRNAKSDDLCDDTNTESKQQDVVVTNEDLLLLNKMQPAEVNRVKLTILNVTEALLTDRKRKVRRASVYCRRVWRQLEA